MTLEAVIHLRGRNYIKPLSSPVFLLYFLLCCHRTWIVNKCSSLYSDRYKASSQALPLGKSSFFDSYLLLPVPVRQLYGIPYAVTSFFSFQSKGLINLQNASLSD